MRSQRSTYQSKSRQARSKIHRYGSYGSSFHSVSQFSKAKRCARAGSMNVRPCCLRGTCLIGSNCHLPFSSSVVVVTTVYGRKTRLHAKRVLDDRAAYPRLLVLKILGVIRLRMCSRSRAQSAERRVSMVAASLLAEQISNRRMLGFSHRERRPCVKTNFSWSCSKC